MTKILEICDLCKSFGGIAAVSHVSFDVEAGQLMAMIGPNGAGKSTCFNLINGQLQPDHGSIKICGQQVVGLSPRQVWNWGVGRTFQIAAIFASMTVLENIQMALVSCHHQGGSFFRKLRHLFVDESMELLTLVGVQDQSHRVCGLLSYGDLKRLELAMALTNRPRLLLMDEPTSGMAPAERRHLMDLVTHIIRSQNVAAVFTEHDMDVVFTHADHIIVLNRGELIAAGTPDEVRANASVREIYLGTL